MTRDSSPPRNVLWKVVAGLCLYFVGLNGIANAPTKPFGGAGVTEQVVMNAFYLGILGIATWLVYSGTPALRSKETRREPQSDLHEIAIEIRGRYYGAIRFFMWVSLGGFALLIYSGIRENLSYAIGAAILIVIGRVGGELSSRAESRFMDQHGVPCSNCSQPIDMKHLNIVVSSDGKREVQCPHCGFPFKQIALPNAR